MENTVENSQIEEFIDNLKGRKSYEYVANKILNNLSKSSDVCKAPKKQVRRKSKTKIKPVSTCGCCWLKNFNSAKMQSVNSIVFI